VYVLCFTAQTIHLDPLLIDNEQASMIIGKEGATISKIRKTSGAIVIVSPPSDETRRVTLEGSVAQITSALNGIFLALQVSKFWASIPVTIILQYF